MMKATRIGRKLGGTRALLEEYHRAWAAIFTAQLDEHGEHEIAELFRTNREEVDRRNRSAASSSCPRVGRLPRRELARLLIEAVGASLAADNLMGPLGILYGEKDGNWEVDIYPTPVELIGARRMGPSSLPPSLWTWRRCAAFERVEDFGWTTIGWADGNGPFIWIKEPTRDTNFSCGFSPRPPRARNRDRNCGCRKRRRSFRTSRSELMGKSAEDQPRPTNGILVAIKVMKRAFASSGRLAM